MHKLVLTVSDEHGVVLGTKNIRLSDSSLPAQEWLWGIKGKELFRDALYHLGLWDQFDAARMRARNDLCEEPQDGDADANVGGQGDDPDAHHSSSL